MRRYEKRFWILAACLAALAGYVDAVGFIKLGGFFVSFMSGNSTRLGVGLVRNGSAAIIAISLIGSFVLGVVLGSVVAAIARTRRMPAVLALVTFLLAGAAMTDSLSGGLWPAFMMAVAMGAENAVFQRDGEVTIGVTYMTGTLVKFGQGVATALMGGERWHWVPYFILWGALTSGAALGALAYLRLDAAAIWIAVFIAALLTFHAATIGPAEKPA